MTAEHESGKGKPYEAERGTLAYQVRNVAGKVDRIINRLKDHYHLLQEILDQATKEDDNGWYDLYDTEGGYH